jgi:ABC-type lipoprotein export system ATPase subunit
MLVDVQAQEGAMLIVVTHSAEMAGLLGRRMELNEGKLAPLP